MKVSDRIKQIRGVVKNGTRIEKELTQLEAEIVEALQIARQEGYKAGRDDAWAKVKKIMNGS